jgi:hypothetical protein
MALRQDFGVDDQRPYFLGENKVLRFEIFGADDVTPIDVATFAMKWAAARKRTGEVLIEKTTADDEIEVTGVFDVDPVVNTQRVEVTVDDSDTDDLAAGVYDHALKRMDTDDEGILSWGDLRFRQAAAR